MGQMRRRRRNLMRSGARWWRLRRRVTHVGMRLLLRWLRRMSVNHPAPAAAAKPVTSLRNHFFFVWGMHYHSNHCWEFFSVVFLTNHFLRSSHNSNWVSQIKHFYSRPADDSRTNMFHFPVKSRSHFSPTLFLHAFTFRAHYTFFSICPSKYL